MELEEISKVKLWVVEQKRKNSHSVLDTINHKYFTPLIGLSKGASIYKLRTFEMLERQFSASRPREAAIGTSKYTKAL